MTVAQPAKAAEFTRWPSFLPWMLPVMLALVALTVLLSGRDLSQMFNELDAGGTLFRHPAIAWAQRVTSLLLLAIAAERMVNHVARHRHLPSPVLAWVFITYWTATVAVPAFFGTHPQVSHEYLYSLIIGLAGLLASESEREDVVGAARNALFLFLLAGVALVAVNPAMVLDASYRQGLMAGVPRLGGLAPHPVALGMLAQIFLLCLWARPLSNRWLNRLAWLLGLAVLFFAQSKTSWVAFILCSVAMLWVRHAGNLWRRVGNHREGAFGIVLCLAVFAFVAALLAVFLLVDIGSEAAGFLDTSEGAQLMTMTGRDQIWAIAWEEWRANPLFGYGPGLWDGDFRASIRLANATSAHNQFLDTLARAGAVGGGALVLYAVVLLVLALRHAKTTGGLSLALYIALALRSISEVPLLLFGYGTEFFTHLLLLITLASAASGRTEVLPAPDRRPARYKAAA